MSDKETNWADAAVKIVEIVAAAFVLWAIFK